LVESTNISLYLKNGARLGHWSTIAYFNLPTSIWRPRLGDPVGISPISLESENYSPFAIAWRCFRDPMLVQYRRVTDGQTDTRTDTRWQHIPL